VVADLITSGVLRRVSAFTELKFSNSRIEAWWRSLKHQWLFLQSWDSVTTVRRLVEFYVHVSLRTSPQPALRASASPARPEQAIQRSPLPVPSELAAFEVEPHACATECAHAEQSVSLSATRC
jgi:hypothetical protein